MTSNAVPARRPASGGRRVAAAGLSLLLTVLCAVFTAALVVALVQSLPIGWAILAVAVVALIVGHSFARGYRALVLADPRPVHASRRGRAGTTSGWARVGTLLSGAVLVFSVPLCLGWAAAWLLSCLRWEYPGQAGARRLLRG